MNRYCVKYGGMYITGFDHLPKVRGYVLGVYAESIWKAARIAAEILKVDVDSLIIHSVHDLDPE
jgi:hypothetical protein